MAKDEHCAEYENQGGEQHDEFERLQAQKQHDEFEGLTPSAKTNSKR